MNTGVQNRLVGVQSLTLALAVTGEYLDSTALAAVGLTGFFVLVTVLSVSVVHAHATGDDVRRRQRSTLDSTRTGR